jgi:hypothetical protein
MHTIINNGKENVDGLFSITLHKSCFHGENSSYFLSFSSLGLTAFMLLTYRYAEIGIVHHGTVVDTPIRSLLHIPITTVQSPCLSVYILYVCTVHQAASTVRYVARNLPLLVLQP